ncbi:MAG: hypothetical protein HY043_01780 [Verrucomicrobia bacterium]|nr:hypothetical protein [Verrucomicrobiota bacterium]
MRSRGGLLSSGHEPNPRRKFLRPTADVLRWCDTYVNKDSTMPASLREQVLSAYGGEARWLGAKAVEAVVSSGGLAYKALAEEILAQDEGSGK